MKINQLPDIPREWGIKQIRHIFDIHNGSTPKSGNPEFWNGNINWITPDDLGSNADKSITSSRRKITKLGYKSCGVSLAPSGSIALSTRAPIGHLAITKMPACVNQGCRILVPKEGVPEYWYYSLISAKSLIVSLGQGTTFMELPRQSLASVALPVPSIDSQKAIAHFLDHKTAQIDALIAKKQSLLDKLAEQRTALISQAVTKGLDPSVPMKDSGVDWLGEIPGHWHRVLLVRLIMRFEQGWSPSCEAREASKDEWGVLKSGCVNHGIFDERQHKTLPASLTPIESLEVKPGNILMCRASGSKHLIGSVARVKSCRANLIFSDKTYRISLNENLIEPDFFIFAMKSKYIREQIELSISGADGLANNIPQASVKSYQFVLPEIDEQRAIVKTLTEQSDRISLQEEKTKAVIERLQEYRSALITNAVTGKIDVRDFCIPNTTEQREVAHG